MRTIVAKVARVHGDNQPHLKQVLEIYTDLAENFIAHQLKEERVLFPAIRAIEAGKTADTLPGSIDEPLQMMTSEHEEAGEALHKLRELTNGFTPAMDACMTHRVMLDSLFRLEQDTHAHVHKEESILFPKARALMQRA